VRSSADCLQALSRGLYVGVALTLSRAWETGQGIISVPDEEEPEGPIHVVGLVGFHLELGAFIARNSWGADWGHGGFGYVSMAYVNARLVEGWITLPTMLEHPRAVPKGAPYVVNWGREAAFSLDPGKSRYVHIIDIYDEKA